MNDQLLALIRFAVATILGASINSLLSVCGCLSESALAEYASAIQATVTVLVYTGISLAARRWPAINYILSLFLSKNGPGYDKQ